MKGRPKKPNYDKRMKGETRPSKFHKEAPPSQPLTVDEISADNPVFPFDGHIEHVEGLTNDRQRKIYEMRCKSLSAMGAMEEPYQESMILYAVWLDRALSSAVEAAHGDLKPLHDANGRVTGYIENPYIRMFERATKMVNEIGRQFGFTPLTRANVAKTEKNIDPAQEIQKLLGG